MRHSAKRNDLPAALVCAMLIALAAPLGLAEDPIRLAVLPMVVHTAEDPGYLREGLADMLAARLEQVDDLEVVRIEAVESATSRLERAIETGRAADADFVLFGSFTRFGQGASLDVQCAATNSQDEKPPLREIFVHSGNIGDVIPDLDDLAGKVARFMIQDYEARVAASSRENGAAAAGPIDALRRRVEALEEALGQLQKAGEPPAAKAPGPTRTEASLR